MAASGTEVKSHDYDDYGGGGNDYAAGGDAYGGGDDNYVADVDGFADEGSGNYSSHQPRGEDEKPKETYVPEDIEDDELFNSAIGSGINFNKYDAIPVKVSVPIKLQDANYFFIRK